MTTQQLYLFSGLYLIALVVVAFFTRATMRRIAGALAGAAVASAVALGADAGGAQVRLARACGGSGRAGGHRSSARLCVYGEVPGVGQLRARSCAGVGYRRDLRVFCAAWACGDAPGRRSA